MWCCVQHEAACILAAECNKEPPPVATYPKRNIKNNIFYDPLNTPPEVFGSKTCILLEPHVGFCFPCTTSHCQLASTGNKIMPCCKKTKRCDSSRNEVEQRITSKLHLKMNYGGEPGVIKIMLCKLHAINLRISDRVNFFEFLIFV